MDDVDERVSRLLDQLEDPNLSQSDVDRIQKKIALLQEQRT